MVERGGVGGETREEVWEFEDCEDYERVSIELDDERGRGEDRASGIQDAATTCELGGVHGHGEKPDASGRRPEV